MQTEMARGLQSAARFRGDGTEVRAELLQGESDLFVLQFSGSHGSLEFAAVKPLSG